MSLEMRFRLDHLAIRFTDFDRLSPNARIGIADVPSRRRVDRATVLVDSYRAPCELGPPVAVLQSRDRIGRPRVSSDQTDG